MTRDRNPFKLNFSRFNTIVAEGDEICIYNSFSGALAVLEASEYSFLKSVVSSGEKVADAQQQDLIDRCLIDNFIIREGSDEIGILKKRVEGSKENTSSLTVTIVPTLSCNFACPYCFEGVDKHSALMPEIIQDRFLDWLEGHSDGLKNLGVTWFGGEPTLGMEVISSLSAKLFEFCTRKKVVYHASMITNGFLLDVPTVRLLKSLRVEWLQLTLDGPRDIHDKVRFLKTTNAGSYDTIIGNVRRYQEECPVRTTFRINVDTNNQNRCFRLIDDLSRELEGCNDVSIYFAPVHASTQMCEHISKFTLEAMHYAQLETKLTEYAVARGMMNINLPNMNMGICAAARKNGMVLSPNGDIHKCWETVTMDRYRIGNITDPAFDLHRDGINWTGWSPFMERECLDCPILPNCMGMCTYRFLFKDNYSGNSAKTPCPSLKFNISERLGMFLRKYDKK